MLVLLHPCWLLAQAKDQAALCCVIALPGLCRGLDLAVHSAVRSQEAMHALQQKNACIARNPQVKVQTDETGADTHLQQEIYLDEVISFLSTVTGRSWPILPRKWQCAVCIVSSTSWRAYVYILLLSGAFA